VASFGVPAETIEDPTELEEKFENAIAGDGVPT
jgi:thiamine pyrophosphate-dependent acetolactate synthase large subunit-like protein